MKKVISIILVTVMLFAAAFPAMSVFAETIQHEDGQHDFVFKEKVLSTCEASGYDLYICACGAYEQRNMVSPSGHFDGNDDGKCDACGEQLPMYFIKHLIYLFLEFMKMVFGITPAKG